MANGATAAQPIVIKRIKKAAHGHHGGAWKVAYADFVTAMMAFFMLLWLMGSTTEQQKRAISDFFQYPSAIQANGGASRNLMPSGSLVPTVPVGVGEYSFTTDIEDGGDGASARDASSVDESADQLLQKDERLVLESLQERMGELIDDDPVLNQFKEQLKVDITAEGLRVQMVDDENRPMFDKGSAEMKDYARVILRQIVNVIGAVPNKISITGHTDARPYPSEKGYSNWELSADRANAARRELLHAGMPERKLGRVVGLAASVLYDADDPFNPVNRRISIVVMNQTAEATLRNEAAVPGDASASALQIVTDRLPDL